MDLFLSNITGPSNDVLFNVLNNSCSIIQIGNKEFYEFKMETQNICFDIAGCHVFLSSTKSDNFIANLKGQLTGHSNSKHVYVFEPKHFKKTHMGTNASFNMLVASYSASIALRRTLRSDWLDIVIRHNDLLYEESKLQLLRILNKGINVMPIVLYFGPTMFSNLDVGIKVLAKNLQTDSNEDDWALRVLVNKTFRHLHRSSMATLSK